MNKGKKIAIGIGIVVIAIILMIPTISNWVYYTEINRENIEEGYTISDSQGNRCSFENYDQINNLCK